MFTFELRLEMINLLTRVIGVHKLMLLNFYDFIVTYLKPHQKDVTHILAYLAQSSHELVPPDAMETVIRVIADNFVWTNCSTEVITAGLNGIREVCYRCPLAMPEDLLQSIVDDYRNYREKGPMTASRALISLYREHNPELLKKKHRGKIANVTLKDFKLKKYGEVDVNDDVLDANVLLD